MHVINPTSTYSPNSHGSGWTFLFVCKLLVWVCGTSHAIICPKMMVIRASIDQQIDMEVRWTDRNISSPPIMGGENYEFMGRRRRHRVIGGFARSVGRREKGGREIAIGIHHHQPRSSWSSSSRLSIINDKHRSLLMRLSKKWWWYCWGCWSGCACCGIRYFGQIWPKTTF